MKVLVCGGRDYENRRVFFREMDRLHQERGPFREVICGGYRGADTLAAHWSLERLRIHANIFNVDPREWSDIKAPGAIVKKMPSGKKYNAAAGPWRNARMLRDGKPNLVIAFPGGDGTKDMIQQSERAGLEVIRVDGTLIPAV